MEFLDISLTKDSSLLLHAIHSLSTGGFLRKSNSTLVFSVADPDPGSGAFLTPGSGIRNRFFPDPGSRIPDPKPILLRV